MSPPILIGLLLAAACAVATNVASVLTHRGANTVPALRARHPVRSVRQLFGSRWFAIGMGLATFAGALHIVALALAPMSIVQVVLAAGVVLLAGVAKRVLGCAVPRRQRIGLIAAAAGLAMLVLSVPPVHGAHGSFATPTLAAFEAAVASADGALAIGPRLRVMLADRGVPRGAASRTRAPQTDAFQRALRATRAALPDIAHCDSAGGVARTAALRGMMSPVRQSKTRWPAPASRTGLLVINRRASNDR